MLIGWAVPAVGIFLITQASATEWRASGTNNQVESNTAQIEQVIDNEKQIAVIEVRQTEMQKDISELKTVANDIYRMIARWDTDE